jgi:hypothetical protein
MFKSLSTLSIAVIIAFVNLNQIPDTNAKALSQIYRVFSDTRSSDYWGPVSSPALLGKIDEIRPYRAVGDQVKGDVHVCNMIGAKIKQVYFSGFVRNVEFEGPDSVVCREQLDKYLTSPKVLKSVGESEKLGHWEVQAVRGIERVLVLSQSSIIFAIPEQ